jgi:hypothetical protein
MTDVPLAALGMLALVLLLYGNGRSSLTIAAGAAFGLAILTKSAAAFLFLPGLLAIAIAQHGFRFLRCRETWLAAILAIAIALPWHVCLAWMYGNSFVDQYLGLHILARFASPLEGHQGSSFYYLDTYFQKGGFLAPVHGVGTGLAVSLAIVRRDRLLAGVSILALTVFAIVSVQGTKIGGYLTPIYPATALAAALGIARLVRDRRALVVLLAATSLLALPGIVIGRGRFAETLDLVHFSPEVRALRNTQLFTNGRVPLLYSYGLSEPALRFYLADDVQPIREFELVRLFSGNQPFLCLTFNSEAAKFASKHPSLRLEIIASTESLALIGYP